MRAGLRSRMSKMFNLRDRVLSPIFQAANSLYDHWKLTRTFGSDLDDEQAELEMQYAIFQRLSKLSIHGLETSIEPGNEQDEGFRIVLRYLNTTLVRFKSCDELMEKYYRSGGKLSVVILGVFSLMYKNLVAAIVSQTVLKFNRELYMEPVL